MRFETRQAIRTVSFELDCLGPTRRQVEHVFDCLDPKTIGVVSAKDRNAVSYRTDRTGARDLDAPATRRVRIAAWFSCACQRIRVEDESDTPSARPFRTPDTLAWYSTNFAQTLFAWDGMRPPVGPGGAAAEIVITFAAERLLADGHPAAFRFVIAHELTHALDVMKWVVPAFRDWAGFCANVNPLGANADQIVDDCHRQSQMLDDYASQAELAMVRRYWPAHADRWFEAAHTQAGRRRRG